MSRNCRSLHYSLGLFEIRFATFECVFVTLASLDHVILYNVYCICACNHHNDITYTYIIVKTQMKMLRAIKPVAGKQTSIMNDMRVHT